MYWAIQAKKMNIWVSYGRYLPQNLSEMAFYLGILMGSLLAFLCIMGILLVTRAKHCIVSCPVSLNFILLTHTVRILDLFGIHNLLSPGDSVPGGWVLWRRGCTRLLPRTRPGLLESI
jgi:hypothetical protein